MFSLMGLILLSALMLSTSLAMAVSPRNFQKVGTVLQMGSVYSYWFLYLCPVQAWRRRDSQKVSKAVLPMHDLMRFVLLRVLGGGSLSDFPRRCL